MNENRQNRKPLTASEVREAFEPLSAEYPPVLSLEQAARISGYSTNTLKKKLSQGSFRNSAARGKPLRFWRDRLVLEVMNRPTRTRRGREWDGGSDEVD